MVTPRGRWKQIWHWTRLAKRWADNDTDIGARQCVDNIRDIAMPMRGPHTKLEKESSYLRLASLARYRMFWHRMIRS